MPTFDSGRARPVLAALVLAVSALLPATALPAQDARGLGIRADTGSSSGLGAYHALLIAVEDYADPGVPQLKRPVRDAESLRGVLTRRYRFEARDIEVLRNATRDEILELLGLMNVVK